MIIGTKLSISVTGALFAKNIKLCPFVANIKNSDNHKSPKSPPASDQDSV